MGAMFSECRLLGHLDRVKWCHTSPSVWNSIINLLLFQEGNEKILADPRASKELQKLLTTKFSI